MTGRNVEYVFPPRAAERRPARRCCGSRDSPRRARSPTCPSPYAPARSSDWPGLVGSGRSEILETVYGARPASGRVELAGKRVRHSVVGNGQARHGPGPRRAQGPGACCWTRASPRNITVAQPAALRANSAGWTAPASGPRRTGWSKALDIRPPDPARPIKNAVGRQPAEGRARPLAARQPQLLLLDEPTRGVDVGARAELYAVIRELADRGIGVAAGLQRGARGARPRRPRPGAPRGPGHPRGGRPANSTSTACST